MVAFITTEVPTVIRGGGGCGYPILHQVRLIAAVAPAVLLQQEGGSLRFNVMPGDRVSLR